MEMKQHILIVDDDGSIRRLFSQILERENYKTGTAANGIEALERLRDENYDLILLDLKMPGMDGVRTLKEIRKSGKDIPIYIVTAFNFEYMTELKKLQQEGIHFEVLKKPIGREKLLAVVKSVFDGPVAI